MIHSISLNEVSYKVKGKRILSDISLNFPPSRITGLIGPNGSGKTTLLRLILGTILPTSGTIEIDGRNISSYSRKELAREMAILCQNTFSNFAFLCHDVVLMGRDPYRGRFEPMLAEDYKIAAEMMKLTDTDQFRDRLINELSGGEEQTVLLGRALTQTPRFLLLDEPTSHLDIYHQIKILELIKNQAYNMGIVLVMHDLNMAARFCDRLVLLSKGRVIAQGTPVEVLTPSHVKAVFHTDSVVRHDPVLKAIQLTFLNNGSINQGFNHQDVKEMDLCLTNP